MKKTNQMIYFFRIIFFTLLLLVTKASAQYYISPSEILSAHKSNLYKNFSKINKVVSPAQNQVDALYYKIELEITFNPDLLRGRVTNRYKIKVDNLNSLEIDFDHNMSISNISGPVLDYTHLGRMININLSQTFNANEVIEVTIEYSGYPDAAVNGSFVFDRLSTGENHVWTKSEPYGAKYWWPCKDTPADKADSVDIIVTVAQNQIVASNGTLISDIADGLGKRTFHWKEKYPIVTYLVSLAIAPYAHFTDLYTTYDGTEMLLDYYVYPQYEQLAREIFPDVKDHLDGLSSYFGPYPFLNEKYGMAQFGWGGGMEHQTLTSIGGVSERWNYIYVHELGHQWFGDALTCASWKDIWLNEGFASYSEALYAEWAGFNGNPPGEDAYHEYMGTQTYYQDGTITVEDTTDARNIFNRIVYDKGSWVLHMLRRVLGDEDFFTSLYTYANGDLIHTSVTTEDFKNICEEVSGKSLDTFFDQWLNYEFYPEYSYNWENDEDIKTVEVTINQNQYSRIFEMPVDLYFMFPTGKDTIVTVQNNQANQHYTLHLTDVPVDMDLDPQNWILKRVQDFSIDEFSSEIIIENIFPNPTKDNSTIIVKDWINNNLTLHVFDVNGKLVTSLLPFYKSSRHQKFYRWNGENQRREKVASGIYFVKPVNDIFDSKNAGKIIILK